MPIIGQQVDPNAVPAASALAPNVGRRLFAMSDGARLAVWTGANGTVYAIRSTGGVWAAPVSIPSATGNMSVYGVGQNGNAVSLFSVGVSGIVSQIKLSYAAGAVTITTPSYTGGVYAANLDVLYNTTLAAWLIAGFDSFNSSMVIQQIAESSSTVGQSVALSGTQTPARVHLTSSGPASNILYLSYQQSGSSLFVAPVSIAGTTIALGTPEAAYPGCTDYSAEIDASGNLDLVVLDERTSGLHSIVAVKRLGVNSYSSPITLYGNTQGATPPVTNYDSTSGNLTVYVQSLANQPNGELLSIQRIGGTWGAAQTVVGGDALGYASPSANRSTVAGVSEYLYLSGTSTALLQYNGAANGSTPTVPVPVSPSGNIAGLLPNFAWNSANPTPSDLPQAREIVVERDSDGVTLWDTGRITTGAPYGYAGTALVYGIRYRWKVREWDTVLNSPSAYSTYAYFTPQSPPVETITGVTNNGVAVANGGNIASTTVAVTFSHTQSGGNSATQANLVLLTDDGTAVVGQTGFTNLSPAIASGASGTLTWELTNNGAVAIANGTYYRARVDVIDSTGLTASSGTFRLHTNWPPPAPVTGFSATPNPVTGTVRLSWTVPAGITGIRVYTRRSPLPGHAPEPWVQFQGVVGGSRLTVYPLLLTKTDYAVQTINAQGISGAVEVLPNVILHLLFGRSYTAWITDTVNPSTSVPVGLANDAGGASTWQHVTGPVSTLYEGHTSPTVDYLPTSYWTATGRKYVVFALDTDNATSLAWRDVRAALTAMDGGNSVLYRDMDNHAYICTLTNFSEGQADAVSYLVSFDLIQTTSTLNPLALWSP